LRSQKKETLFTDAQRIMAQAGCILGKEVPKWRQFLKNKGPKMDGLKKKADPKTGNNFERSAFYRWT
jgi:hypothetical protein